MTPERINQVIGEHLGWVDGCWIEYACTCIEGAKSGQIWSSGGYTSPTGARCAKKPDFYNDLNAMHEAEETLTEAQLAEYDNQLRNVIIQRDPGFPKITARIYYWHAKAPQRAEAFLRVFDKWAEETK